MDKNINKEGYKKTKLGWIPVDWEVATLSHFSEFITKGATPTTYGFDWVNTGILFLRSECVSKNGFSLNGTMYISKEANEVMKRSQIEGGDILMTITGNVGRVCIFPKKYMHGNINQHIAKIRLNDSSINKNYVFQYLLQEKVIRDYYKITTGQAYPQLSLQQVRSTKLILPPLAEQKKIAQILSTWDQAIAKTRELIEQKKLLKKGLMQNLLTGKLRFGEFVQKEGYKKTKLGDIPVDWEVVKFKELYEKPIRDFGSFSSTKLITFLESGIPFIKSEMIDFGKIKWETIFYISKEVHQKLNKSVVHPKQILFSKIGSALGKAVVYEGEYGECNSNAAIAKITIDEEKADRYFTTYILNSSLSKRQFKMRIISLLPRLNLGDINSVLFPLPPLTEQKKIAQVLSNSDQEIQNLEAQLAQFQAQKKGLMQQLLTGAVRVEV